ncbi:ABC transporter permease [Microbacterium gorillae]|uniref:ABC transporter permease n=1 Tax=Microbacterium gorillae TaxID=1231063 RepID=UPI00058EEF38|nr:ABC transporter permease subunit [Microbacterium gorillae]
MLVTSLLVGLVVVVPVLFMVFASFRGPGSKLPLSPNAETTLANYVEVFGSAVVGRTLVDTAIYVGGSLLVAMVIGVPLAWLLERSDLPGRRFIWLLVFAPMVIPSITDAQMWALLFAERYGLFNRILRVFMPSLQTGPLSPSDPFAMVLAQGMMVLPFVVLFLQTTFRNMDSSYTEASLMSGARGVQTFLRVTLRLALPAILSVALLLSVTLLGAFEIPLVFGIGEGLTPLGVRLYVMLNPAGQIPAYGEIAAFGVLITLISFVLILAYSRFTRSGDSYATLGGKGVRSSRTSLGAWRWPLFAVIGVFLVVTVGSRLLMLVAQSLMPVVANINLTTLGRASFQAYERLFANPAFPTSIRITATVAILSAIVTVVLPFAMAWIVVRFRGKRWVRTVLDLMASASLGVPGPVAGFAFLILFLALNTWIPLYGTIAALTFAYCFRVGYSYRYASAAMIQINKDLEEASSLSGASRTRTLRSIIAPLLAPTVIFLFVLQLMTAVQEFSVPLFLPTTDGPPLSVFTFNLINTAKASEAAAVGVLTVLTFLVVIGVGALIARRFRPTEDR